MNLPTILRAYDQRTALGVVKNQKFNVLLHVLVELIDTGLLPEGSPLPPTRTLSAAIRLSRSTVAKAYEHLLFLGKAQSRQGSKVWVAAIPFRSAEPQQSVEKTGAVRLSELGRAFMAQSPEVRSSGSSVHPLQPGVPPLDLFPVNQWRALTNDYWRNVRISGLTYSSSAGQQILKQTLSQLLYSERGIRCDPDQIVVVSGSVQSLFLVGSLLLNPNDLVALENPSFPNVHRIFSGLRAQKISIHPENAHSLGSARLAHVALSEGYPFGAATSAEQRVKIADHLGLNGGYLIENDYEYSASSAPNQSLLAYDASRSNVIYLSTFNRVLHPSIRIGFMVLPHELIRPMHSLMGQSHRFVSTSAQTVLNEFIQAGHWQQHSKSIRKAVVMRKAALREAVLNHFPDSWNLQLSDHAQHACLIAPEGSTLNDRMRHDFTKVGINPHILEDHYWTGKSRSGLVLGSGSVHDSQMNHWVQQLAEICLPRVDRKLDYKKL